MSWTSKKKKQEALSVGFVRSSSLCCVFVSTTTPRQCILVTIQSRETLRLVQASDLGTGPQKANCNRGQNQANCLFITGLPIVFAQFNHNISRLNFYGVEDNVMKIDKQKGLLCICLKACFFVFVFFARGLLNRRECIS